MSMYARQNQLLKLPLPRLRDTCDKLLEWSGVFLDQEELEATATAVENFVSDPSSGPWYQHHLEKLNQQPEHLNWLEPLWKTAYLGNPDPLPMGGNVTFIAAKNPGTRALGLAKFVTSLIKGLVDFNRLIQSESLEPDFQGKNPLCMTQYRTLFGTSRIPGREQDAYFINPTSRHVIVIHRGRHYALDVLDKEGNPVDSKKITVSLQSLLATDYPGNAESIGSLTSLGRRGWALSRQSLIDLSEKNRRGFQRIEGALAVIVLDENTYPDKDSMFKHLLGGDPSNRWYDKSLQFIIGDREDFGINYEHSGVDGTTLGRLVSYLYDHLEPLEVDSLPSGAADLEPIDFDMEPVHKKTIENALKQSRLDFDNLSLLLVSFDEFGKDHIKKIGVSPDAFLQLSLQLAQYTLFGSVANTYEAVMTKTFLGGRTETMRPVTRESLAFVREPDSRNLKIAAEKHIQRIRECQQGQGVDRHLFGLRTMHERYRPDTPLPPVFQSPGYLKLTTSYFSTSTSSSKGMLYAGYGPLIDDGYAARYLIFSDRLTFVLSAKKGNESLLKAYRIHLVGALRTMGAL
ncbi:MAG: hypothetical protein AVO33_09065 [delta proteobacterium ML8_F1]|nr:MAG: hypothetical protein AVO33_09065 [delta proteobacterium ML8_F1]